MVGKDFDLVKAPPPEIKGLAGLCISAAATAVRTDSVSRYCGPSTAATAVVKAVEPSTDCAGHKHQNLRKAKSATETSARVCVCARACLCACMLLVCACLQKLRVCVCLCVCVRNARLCVSVCVHGCRNARLCVFVCVAHANSTSV